MEISIEGGVKSNAPSLFSQLVVSMKDLTYEQITSLLAKVSSNVNQDEKPVYHRLIFQQFDKILKKD